MTSCPVCGMEVVEEAASREHLHADYGGARYLFCSLACFQVFQMNPNRFAAQDDAVTGHCELCSKTIKKDDDFSTLSIRGTSYKFCCSSCASVYSSAHDTVARPDSPSEITKERLASSGLLPWLEEAVHRNASDLFLSVGEDPTLKIYGVFKQLEKGPLRGEQFSKIIESFMPEKKRAEFIQGRDVDMGIDVPGCSRFRVNVFRHQKGDSVAIRPLPYKIPSMDELGLPPVFHDFCKIPRGLILITGPTGSGKSTTLAALVDTINRTEEKHIITIEDPIEYLIPNQRSLIHQREVGWHTPSFADGLRSALREHPDVIVVGELRDLESISLAIRAAETGHLVLGTLHSGTAMQSLTRLLDVFEAGRQSQIRVQLAQSLQAICVQRLFRRKIGQGMVVATEILIATLAIRTLIRENRIHEVRGFISTGQREQMHSFEQSIQKLINEGVVSSDASSETTESPVPEIPISQIPSRRWSS